MNKLQAKQERIRDPVHDLIEFGTDEFERTCWDLIQTRPFQRLRRVKQLGFSELTYPGATHSRLAHSLGVFHTARQLAATVEKLRGTAFNPRRAQVAVAAALVHDLGHGPFSHAFEEVLKRLSIGRHELMSVRLIRETSIRETLDQFESGFADEVAGVIGSDTPRDVYASIVSSQFDADRLDYMRRDRLMTGTQEGAIDFRWLMANLEVRKVPLVQDDALIKNVETLVLGPKALLAAETYVLGLFHLYPTVYLHKTTRGADKMFAALLERLFVLARDGSVKRTGLPASHPLVRFPREPDNISRFLELDDGVVWGAVPSLRDAKDTALRVLAGRLADRKLYKAVDVSARLNSNLKKEGKFQARCRSVPGSLIQNAGHPSLRT